MKEPSIWGDVALLIFVVVIVLFVMSLFRRGRWDRDWSSDGEPPTELPTHWDPYLRRRWSKMNNEQRKNWFRQVDAMSTWVTPVLFAGVIVSAVVLEQIVVALCFGLALAVVIVYVLYFL